MWEQYELPDGISNLIENLKHRLLQEGFDSNAYVLGEQTPGGDAYVLRYVDGTWRILYFERGHYDLREVLGSEEEACEHFYELLARDPTTRKGGVA